MLTVAMPDVSAFFSLAPGQPLAAELIAAASVLLLTFALVKALRPWQHSLYARPLLTPNEREFFHRLTKALPGYHIFPQVCFGAFLAVDPRLSRRQQFSLRRRFAWKVADFVICAPGSLDILLLIELDDRTHDARHDRKRDAMTKAAGYQTLRFHSKRKPTVTELAQLFAKLLPTLKL